VIFGFFLTEALLTSSNALGAATAGSDDVV
jgi:hypothetical protein